MQLSSDLLLEPGLDQRIAQAIERRRPALKDRIDSGVIEALAEYTRQLSRWNAVHNLTAIESVDEVIQKHLIDAVGAWPGTIRCLNNFAVEHSLRGRPEGNSPYAIDVGSGNGVPGLVLAILSPGLRIYFDREVVSKSCLPEACRSNSWTLGAGICDCGRCG